MIHMLVAELLRRDVRVLVVGCGGQRCRSRCWITVPASDHACGWSPRRLEGDVDGR